jgi:nucleoid-associated protein EbfC
MKLNMQSIMQQAQKVQQEIERIKIEAEQKTVTSDAGGGMVIVTMNGANKVLGIKISKEAVDPNDIEMLEDLIVAAVNKASKEAADMVSAEMSKVTGMLPNIPGMNLNF